MAWFNEIKDTGKAANELLETAQRLRIELGLTEEEMTYVLSAVLKAYVELFVETIEIGELP